MRRIKERLGIALALAYGAAAVAAVVTLTFAGQLEPITATIDGQVCRVWIDDCGNVCQGGYCELKGCPEKKQPMCIGQAPRAPGHARKPSSHFNTASGASSAR